MDSALIYQLTGVALFVSGLTGVTLAEHPLRQLLAVNVAGSGVFLYLIAAVYPGETGQPDPVPHALVLTGIVVAVSATGLGLSLVRRLQASTSSPGSRDPETDS